MANLYLAFEVVFPILAYMMVGFGAAKLRIWDEKTALSLNKLIFTFYLPLLLFDNIRGINLAHGLDYRVFVFVMASVCITFGLLCLLIPRIEKDNARRGVMIQGIFRSNYIIFGIPMTQTILGPDNLGYTAALVSMIIPTFNAMGILSIELFREGKIRWGKILKNVAKNPFIIASLLGFFVLIAGIRFPSFLDATVTALGRTATPIALAAMGGCFRFEGAKDCLRPLIISVCGKLLFMPILWLTVGVILFGFRGEIFVSLLALYGAPQAVSSYAIAQQMGGDAELASQIVVYTAVFSILSIFVLTFATKSMGLF